MPVLGFTFIPREVVELCFDFIDMYGSGKVEPATLPPYPSPNSRYEQSISLRLHPLLIPDRRWSPTSLPPYPLPNPAMFMASVLLYSRANPLLRSIPRRLLLHLAPLHMVLFTLSPLLLTTSSSLLSIPYSPLPSPLYSSLHSLLHCIPSPAPFSTTFPFPPSHAAIHSSTETPRPLSISPPPLPSASPPPLPPLPSSPLLPRHPPPRHALPLSPSLPPPILATLRWMLMNSRAS